MLKTNNTIESTLLEEIFNYQKKLFNQEALACYIAPQVIRFTGDEHPEDAFIEIKRWLEGNQSTLLLLGDSGAGKTLFNQWLTQTLFETRLKGDETYPIPLFIPLLAQSRPKTHLLLDYFSDTLHLDNKSMDWLAQQPLLLILDGFDELHERTNLYLSNKLWNYKAKVLMSCRSQALANVTDKSLFFVPYDQKEQLQKFQLCEWTIAPFNPPQIDAYLSQYIKQNAASIKTWMAEHPNTGNWLEVQTYQSAFKQFYTLKELVTSPFVLNLVAQVLPEIMLKPNLKMACLHLYDAFTEQWFERQRKKLIEAQHIKVDTPILDAYRIYSKKIAETMLQQKVSSILCIPEEEKKQTIAEMFQNLTKPINPFKWFFEEKDIELPSKEKIKLSFIRAGIPLIQINTNQFAFLHKSLLEYFAARHLFESAMAEASLGLGLSLNESYLIDELDTLHFIVDQVREDQALQKMLFQILEESKTEPRLTIAASNAITILHQAGISLVNKNFKRIKIRKADLSGALLDGCDFTEADLREVNLNLASLNQVQMNGALMKDIYLGQKPKIEVESPLDALVYSPQGNMLAAGCTDHTIKLYHPGQAKPFKVLKGHTDLVNTLAFSPDGKTLASGSYDTTIRIWDPILGKPLITLKGHTNIINNLAFSPNGQILASASSDDLIKEKNLPAPIRLWDYRTGKIRTTLGVKGVDEVLNVAFSPDDQTLAFPSDSNIYFWSLQTNQIRDKLILDRYSIKTIVFSHDGKLLASGSEGHLNDVYTIHLWNLDTRKVKAKLEGHTSSINTLVFNFHDFTLISGSKDQSIRIWDLKTGKSISLLGHGDSVVSLAIYPDGHTLVSGSTDGTIRFWEANFKQLLTTPKGQATITTTIKAVALNPNKPLLASSSGFKTIELWDLKTGKLETVLTGKEHSSYDTLFPDHLPSFEEISSDVRETYNDNVVDALAFSPDGRTLASGGKKIKLWNLETGKIILTLNAHTKLILVLAFSPDGHTLASTSDDTTICMWNLKTGQVIANLKGHTKAVLTLSFNSKGNILASGSRDSTIRLWSFTDGQCLATLNTPNTHKSWVNSIIFNPEGDILASGGSGVHLWNPLTGEMLSKLERNIIDFIDALTFSPNGKILASATRRPDQGHVCLWDWRSKEILQTFSFRNRVENIFWHKQNYFIIFTENNIECGVLKDNKFFLLWRTRQYLNLNSAQLGGAVGLNEQDYTLLNQEGGEGIPSTKLTEKIIEQRAAAKAYTPKKTTYSLLSQGLSIAPNLAVVSMVKKKSNFHVFLIIETVEDNFCIIRQADFFLDQKQKSLQIGLFAKGKAIIEMVHKSEFDMEQLLTEGCQTKSWQINSKDAHKLINLIIQDQNLPMDYANFATQSFDANSCLTWCEEKLTQIGIDISKQKSWLDVLVALPSIHMKEEKPKSKFKLSLPFFKTKSTDDENNNNAASSKKTM